MASKRWRCSYCHRTVTKDIKPTSDGCPGNKKNGKNGSHKWERVS